MTRPSAPARRRFVLAACAAAAAFAPLGARAWTFPFIPNHYTFSKDDVQHALARKFPYERTVAQVVDVSLSDPIVGLRPNDERVAVQLDAHVASPFLQAPVDGTFTVSGQLAYDAPSRSVLIKSPVVERVNLNGAAQAYDDQVTQAAGVLATQLLTDYPIYTFKPDQLEFGGVHYEPGTISILTNGIRVTIVEK